MNIIHVALTGLTFLLTLTGSLPAGRGATLGRILRVTGFLTPLIDVFLNSSGALGFQVFFVALASMVAVAVTLHSEGYYKAAGIQALRKQLLFNTMLSSTLLVFNARTLGELTVGLLLLDTLAIIATISGGSRARAAALLYAVLNMTPSIIALISAWTCIGVEGSLTTGFSELSQVSTPQLAAVALLAGFTARLGLAPFHAWLPIVDEEIPEHASAVLSSLVVKTGVFSLLLASSVFELSGILYYVILVQSAATALYGGLKAALQRNIREVLAYSTLSHTGVIGVLYSLTMLHGGGLLELTLYFYVVYHGLVKAHAFMNTALVGRLAGTLDVYKLGYLGGSCPILLAPALTVFLNLAGIPPSYGFPMKLTPLVAVVMLAPAQGPAFTAAGVVLAASSALSILYSARFIACYTGGYRRMLKPPAVVTREELASEYYLASATLILPLLYIAVASPCMPLQLAVVLIALESLTLPLYATLVLRRQGLQAWRGECWLAGAR
ncbi:MAG: proton-conducting transporter membrane subunit [Desulfurococcus sp.]|nr:proton-conducting transporter membrane subunit [Desulfurococcus sp.]